MIQDKIKSIEQEIIKPDFALDSYINLRRRSLDAEQNVHTELMNLVNQIPIEKHAAII